MNDAPIDDEMLSAWVDGELDAPTQERVARWLAEHPEAEAKVRHWAADRDALRERLAPLLDEPIPPGLRDVLSRRTMPRWALAAAAVGLLLTGGLAGGLLVQQWPATAVTAESEAWVHRAAAAHAVYVPEPRHAVEVKAQEEHLARWLTRRIAVPVKLFDLSSQGFELVGGRLLPDGDGKSAQLMYQDIAGRRVTVYLRKPESGTEAAFQYERERDLGLFYWVESGIGYALVGALPKETLLALAQAIYDQHPKP